MKHLRSLVLLAACLLCGGPQTARAAGNWNELGFFLDSNPGGSVIGFSPVSSGRFALTEPLWAETAWGMGLVVASGSNGGAAFSLGNPYLGLLVADANESMSWYAGGGATLPLAQARSLSEAAALALFEGMRSRWDPWLWMPSRLSIVGRAGLRVRVSPELVLITEGALAPMIWFGAGSRPVALSGQLSFDTNYRIGERFSGGTRFTLVTGENAIGHPDLAQLGIEPYLRLHAAGGMVYEVKLTMPIDLPYGFAFGPGGTWGLRLAAGVPF